MHKLKLNIFLCILFFPLSLISETVDDRSVRPDVAGIKESDAIVGPNNSSLDQAFIAQKLGLIKKCLCSLSIDITGVFTVLEELGLCDPIPLTQADVIDGAIRLDIPGFNYCFAENITGTLEITANNINVDLNDRVLFGIIIIDADEITIENGKINPPAPNPLAFNSPALFIGSENIVLRDLLIVCEDTTVPDVSGRVGIENNGNKTQIINCSIKSGSAFGSTNATPANGGIGILNFGNNLRVMQCLIETGSGGNEIGAGTVGNGGTGIESSQTGFILIDNCSLLTHDGGNSQNVGGSGGSGIIATNGSYEIINCTIITGNGGAGLVEWGSRGNGMSFSAQAQNVFVENCNITTGFGRLGFGIDYISDALCKIHNCCIITGSARSIASFSQSNSIGIRVRSPLYNELVNITIITGAGDNSGIGGNGIQIVGPGLIEKCNILTGKGGDGALGVGGSSGSGILTVLAAIEPDVQIHIKECIIKVGDPGVGPGGAGARGIGIGFFRVDRATVIDTIVSNAGEGYLANLFSNNLCFLNCKAIQCSTNGFAMVSSSNFTITNCQSISNGNDGFLLTNNAFNGHVISNQANSNGGTGINNTSGDMTRHQIYNNVSSQNGVANYAAVALVENAPTVNTGFYANVI